VETLRPPDVPRVKGTELERRSATVQEFLGSPASFLASFFSRKNHEHNLFLITGPSGSGKTTWCEALADHARQVGISPVGLISPPVYSGETKTAIDLLDLQTQERRRLAWLRASHESTQTGPATIDWQFDPQVLAWGDTLLRQTDANQEALQNLLILDELGPLEFVRGQGWQSGLRLVDRRSYRLACVVVRPALLSIALERWPWGKARIVFAETLHEAPA
jgi:nucleoside-triphosphatase THEP1